MTIQLFCDKEEIDDSVYSHIVKEKTLSRYSELENLLSILNAYKKSLPSCNTYFEEAIKNWKAYHECNVSDCDRIQEFNSQLFILEQMSLSAKSKMGKRYSSDLITFSFSIYIKSPSAYRFLYESNILSIPSVNHLKYLTPLKLNQVTISESNKNYIKGKCDKLNEEEKLVNLLIDEIHVKPKVTYKGKCISGIAQNKCTEATTIQSFMISSLFSSYKEIVALVPVCKMTGDDLFKLTSQALRLLDETGFSVLTIISDNNRINRNMFEKIARNKDFSSAIKNPVNERKELFLMFDSVHLLKSIRNNWLNQLNTEKTFQCPSFDDFTKCMEVHFSLLRKIYHNEKDMIIKQAFKLNYKSLYPKNIERQNVELALRIFHESNPVALKLQGENCFLPDWEDTAVFLTIIKKWWDIMNVSHLKKGSQTRNCNSKPFENILDDRLIFLENFIKWLKEWRNLKQKSRCGCLSEETFFALIQTCSVINLVIKKLLSDGATFVLTSKFQTDQLEARFGKYRQLSGANYHVSVQQVFESEHKLRIQSILQLHSAHHGNISIKALFSCFETEKINSEIDINLYLPILDDIDLDTIQSSEIQILTYIAGYCTYKLQLSCLGCKLYFTVTKDFTADANEYLPMPSDNSDYYLELLNRGGLKYPSEFVLKVISFVYLIFQKLLSSDYETSFLTSSILQHSIVQKLAETHLISCELVNNEQLCDICKEKFFSKVMKVISIFINICLNNYTKVLQDCVTEKSQNKSDERKLKKFKSKYTL